MKKLFITISVLIYIMGISCKKEKLIKDNICYLSKINYSKSLNNYNIELIYNANDQVIRTNFYDKSGKLMEYSINDYDNGKITKSQGYFIDSTPTKEYSVFEYKDDNLIRLKAFSNNYSFEDEFEYDKKNKIIKQISYSTGASEKIVQNYCYFTCDNKGNITNVKAYDKENTYLGEVSYSLDNKKNYLKNYPIVINDLINVNNVISIKNFDREGNLKNEANYNFSYNEYNYPVKQILNDGSENTFEYTCK